MKIIARCLLSLRVQLLTAFSLVSAITLTLGLLATAGVRQSGTAVVDMFGQSLLATSYARSAAAGFAAMDAASAHWASATDDAGRSTARGKVEELAGLVFEDLEIARQRNPSPSVVLSAERAAQGVEAWLHGFRAQTGGSQPGESRLDQSRAGGPTDDNLVALADEGNERIDVLVNMVAGLAFKQRQHAEASVATMTFRTGLGTVTATVFGLVVATLLARQMLGPIRAASRAARAIAAGQLDTPLPLSGSNELGTMLLAMGTMRDSVRAMIEAEQAERRGAQKRLVDAMEGSTHGIVLLTGDHAVVAANARARELLGVGAGLEHGTDWRPGLAATLGAELVAEAEARQWSAVLERERADATWLRLSCAPAQSGGGFVALLSDITEGKRQEEALAAANRQARAALDNMTQGLCMVDGSGRVTVCNDRFCELFGFGTPAETIGRDTAALFGNMADGSRFPASLIASVIAAQRAVGPSSRPTSFTRSAPSGEGILVKHEALPDGGWIATYEDVTALQRAEREAAYMALHDPLTRLGNRGQFCASLEQRSTEIGGGKGFAVFCLDLNRFGTVNETWGNPVGDQVLCEVAARLRTCVRGGDVVARLGGDDFAILQTAVDDPAASGTLAQRLLDTLDAPFSAGSATVRLEATIGIALAPTHAQQPDRLLRLADSALFRAKAAGGSCFRLFDPSMDKGEEMKRGLELELRAALAGEQFVVHYQPLVDLRLRRVASFEALVRWRHPERGMIPPGRFIPLAEETGLIAPIGDWVLAQACKDATLWPDPTKVAVNISPLQFGNPALVATVERALRDSGLPSHRLELEITESTLLGEGADTMGMLHQLHELGISIAMDDFGTGYSSFGYLRRFPFDKLKIDKSFIDDLAKTAEAEVIARAMISLGANLGMRVVAEGVEQPEQLRQLRRNGCHEIQGYLFGRPTDVAETGAALHRVATMLAEEEEAEPVAACG